MFAIQIILASVSLVFPHALFTIFTRSYLYLYILYSLIYSFSLLWHGQLVFLCRQIEKNAYYHFNYIRLFVYVSKAWIWTWKDNSLFFFYTFSVLYVVFLSSRGYCQQKFCFIWNNIDRFCVNNMIFSPQVSKKTFAWWKS